MAWRKITLDQIKGRVTPQELSALQQVASSGLGGDVDAGLTERLLDAVGQFVGAMSAAAYPVNMDGSLPDQLRNHAMAAAVWEWLKDFPKFEYMQTEQRRKAYDEAMAALKDIRNRKYGALESTTGTDYTTGNWNSEQKLVMRTHPIPNPASQYPTVTNPPAYANPAAPKDT